MINYILKIILLTLIISVNSKAQTINTIVVNGNERISTETIIMFSDVNKSNVNDQEINNILKNLYNTNFFENVEVSISDKLLKIKVKENPIINSIVIEGLKINSEGDLILSGWTKVTDTERDTFLMKYPSDGSITGTFGGVWEISNVSGAFSNSNLSVATSNGC